MGSIRRRVKKPRFCCNHPTAPSDLPSCEQARAISTSTTDYDSLDYQASEPLTTPQVTCPSGANFFESYGKCYYVETQRMNNEDAKNNCRNIFNGQGHGRLYEPRNQMKYDYVTDRISSNFPNTRLWIGIKKNGGQMFNYLSDGRNLQFVQWGDQQPSNNGDCV